MSSFNIDEIPTQKGKIAIITGANSGIGFETAKALSKKDFIVVMACRDLVKAKSAKASILQEHPSATIDCMVLDLSDLQSVKDFSEEFLVQYSQLDLLINNAGIMMPPYSLTVDGFESQFGINYIGHFALTGRLINCLENTKNARIINLSSLAHNWADIYFNDLNFKTGYKKRKAYGQSKLACLMFSYELCKRLHNKNSSTLSIAVHPGATITNLTRYMPKWTNRLLKLLEGKLFQNAKNGALSILKAALDPNVRSGDYYGPSGFKELTGNPTLVNSSKTSYDSVKSKKLWDISEQLTEVEYLS